MQIKEISITNFMGIEELTVSLPQVMALVGLNGTGKTSLLNAIRYGITGVKPEGDIIKRGSDFMNVTTVLTKDGEELSIKRCEYVDKPGKWYINGVPSTQKATNQTIEDFIGIPLDKVKITSSGDLVASMKPQEFSNLILDYIPEEISLVDVFGFIPDSTAGMMEICEALLPSEGINLDVLDETETVLKATRKDLKSSLAIKQAAFDSKPSVSCGMSREEAEKELTEINAYDNKKKVYDAEIKSYTAVTNSIKLHEERVKKLKESISEYSSVTKPDPFIEKKIIADMNELNNSISNNNKAIAGAETALKQLKLTLDALSKPVCPISPLITCHENKLMAMDEITESITATEEGLMALTEENSSLMKKRGEKEEELTKFKDNVSKYEKKLILMQQLADMEKKKPEAPVKPEPPEIQKDAEIRKFQLSEKLKNIIAYEEGVILSKQIEELKLRIADYDSLCKAFAEKGPVRTGILAKYLGVFEKICNERSQKIRPEISFRFVNDNGVVVFMNNGKGTFLTYNELSGGERAYFLFIIMDMLNQLTGVNILILDELSVVDEKCLDMLLDTVLNNKEDYDHILLASVDHNDIKDMITKKLIPTMDMDTGKISA